MENIEENIRQQGGQWLLRYGTDQLDEIDERLLDSPSYLYIWKQVLKSSLEQSPHREKCRETILKVLKKMDNQEVAASVSSAIILELRINLAKFHTEFVLEICDFCLEGIRSKAGSSTNSWKDLLPDIIQVLSSKDTLIYNEVEYKGIEFKNTIINLLCVPNWCPSKITQITVMFSEISSTDSLTKEEHTKIVKKLSCYIEKLSPQEVPPFIYQLIRLCKHQNIPRVFTKLQQYFSLKIYQNASFTCNLPSSSNFDSIESGEDHDILEAESMVLFHIQNAAVNDYACIKDYLNSLKTVLKSPEFILNPFQVLILLSIATKNEYQDAVFDVLRPSIVKFYTDMQKKLSSYWYRELITTLQKPEDVFKKIIEMGDREALLEAFVNFGFALLNIGAGLGRDVIAEKQWTLGTMILLKIIKRKRNVISIVLENFSHHILTRNSASQHIDCLYYLFKTSPFLMLENQNCIMELMECAIGIRGQVAKAKELLEALMPMTAVSPAIRDQLLLILRRCIFSKSIETNQIAVYGFVKFLSTLKISNPDFAVNQSISSSLMSGYSMYTQISLSRTTQSVATSVSSNEAICWEILGFLKHCLTEQAEVKLELYEGLCNAVQLNAELGACVLDVLWCHFREFYVMDDESNIPIHISNVTRLKNTECVLQEPLGKLIFVIAQLVAKLNGSAIKYTEVLDTLCRRMANCELVHFELDDGTDLNDILPESQQKMLTLKEILNIFEALLGYKIITLSSDNDNQCGIINNLYQGYSRFLHFGKNLAKPKKGKKSDKSTSEDNEASQKSATSQTNVSKKAKNEPKTTPKPFKAPDTVLDFATVEKGLETLLGASVTWVSTNDANVIKTKTELHRHFLHVLQHLVHKAKHYKSIDGQYYKGTYGHLESISKILYNRIIKRLSDYIDFDCGSAILGLECFHGILVLVNAQFKRHLAKYLCAIGGQDETLSITDHLKPILEEFEKLFEAIEDDLTTDPEIKKYHLAVLNNIIALCSLIPSETNVLSIQVYDWLTRMAGNDTIPSKVAGSFMNLLFEIHLRYKSGLAIFEQISTSFSEVYPPYIEEAPLSPLTQENNEILRIVDAGTANSIILSLCSFNKTIMDDAENVIARIKSDYSIIINAGENEDVEKIDDLKSKEKGVTGQLCFIARILTNLTSLTLPSGNLSDAVFKNVIQFYTTMSSLTRYFITKSTKTNQTFQAQWFEKLVKITGKKLAHTVNGFVYQLQQDRGDDDQTQRKKVESTTMKSKVLRETKNIPKIVYAMERFSKFIMHLSRKTKCDLTRFVGQGIIRDFRISHEILDEVRRGNRGGSQENDLESQDVVSDNEAEIVGSDDENAVTSSSPPPSKKTKR